MKKQYMSIVMATALGIATVVTVFAQSNNPTTNHIRKGGLSYQENNKSGRGQFMRSNKVNPMVIGTVTSINGNNIIILGQRGFMGTSTPNVTFTVDATNTKITKDNATTTLSTILNGDTIFVQGKINGTNIIATIIRDGKNLQRDNKDQMQQNVTEGNGQPVIAGNVVSINGNTLTITNKSNVSYSVDITNAKIISKNSSITATSIAIGDKVIVQGQINGNSVIASIVTDNGSQKVETNTNNQPKQNLFNRFIHFFGF